VVRRWPPTREDRDARTVEITIAVLLAAGIFGAVVFVGHAFGGQAQHIGSFVAVLAAVAVAVAYLWCQRRLRRRPSKPSHDRIFRRV
jgi:drug/metabolite transporter (DMT)-like permease